MQHALMLTSSVYGPLMQQSINICPRMADVQSPLVFIIKCKSYK